MPFGFARIVVIRPLLVVALASLVHWPGDTLGAAAETRGKAKLVTTTQPAGKAVGQPARRQALPLPVAEIRDAILAAVASGSIEELRTPLDWNELKPEVADTPVTDPIAYWRQISVDGDGREILTILGEILTQPFAVLPVGRDAENNRLYVWPRFAEIATDQLSPDEIAARDRLVPPAVLEEMARTGRYLSWRLAIGADGTWHSFVKAR